MKLQVQPQEGVANLVRGIDSAKKSVEIAIFDAGKRLGLETKRGGHQCFLQIKRAGLDNELFRKSSSGSQ